MTPETVKYSLQGQIATIRIDDGKRNNLIDAEQGIPTPIRLHPERAEAVTE